MPNDNIDVEKCDFLCVHKDTVREVLDSMPDDEKLYDLAELFKVFGDSTRIKILYALFEKELCVCDISNLLGISQTAVSHQLKILKTNNLVKSRRNGKIVFYSLDDDHVYSIIGCGMEHINEL
ncbi:MAG: winged helix-turn-helix transcriptional regulator [Clostridia bacterium]|nr:winged helix-turn-helix transcriptional regulator [Clostridia bacterium]